jgi:conjugal transfer/entry exclusion protein
MVAIVAIMVAILAAIFNMVANFEVLQCSNYKENLYLGVFRGM